jgi:hypothetical protein
MDDLVLKPFGKSKKSASRKESFFDELTILEEMQSKLFYD